MNSYRLIGFDMDGTILNSEKQISPRTIEAVNEAVALGYHVILSTGRGLGELGEYEKALEQVHYYVCESGALVYDSWNKEVLHSKTLTPETVLRLFDIASTKDAMPYLMSNGYSYASAADIANLEHFHMGIYQNMMDRVPRKVDNVAAFYRSAGVPVEKLNLFCASAQIREEISAAIAELPLTAAYAEETSIELSPLHVSKASGLLWLCGYLGISPEQTIIVGDADNDAEAMKAAGLAIAMGNALPHIKELCGAVVADNDHDGCAEAIYKYLFSSTNALSSSLLHPS